MNSATMLLKTANPTSVSKTTGSSSWRAPLAAALTIQDGGQVCPSDADPTNVEGVFWKSVGANFSCSGH